MPPFTGLLGGSEKSTVNGGVRYMGAGLNSGLRKLIISLNGCLLPFIIFYGLMYFNQYNFIYLNLQCVLLEPSKVNLLYLFTAYGCVVCMYYKYIHYIMLYSDSMSL